MRQEAREAARKAGKLGGRGEGQGKKKEGRAGGKGERAGERAETGKSGGWNWRKRLRRESEATSRREMEDDKEKGELRLEGNVDKY